MIGLAFAAALAASVPAESPALQGFMKGDQLETHCIADGDGANELRDICFGYLAGAWDSMLVRRTSESRFQHAICPPDDLSLEEVRIGLIDYLVNNPAQRQSAAALLVERAAMAAYPCDLASERYMAARPSRPVRPLGQLIRTVRQLGRRARQDSSAP